METPASLRIVIDHIDGSRRGQRQELACGPRVRFGRHPDCEITFDAHRDLDASSRHAELRQEGDRFVLVDTGSSNGTFVGGERIAELEVTVGTPIEIEFGGGGPRLRLLIGDDAQVAALPGLETTSSRAAPGRRQALWLVGVVAVVALLGLLGWRLAG